MAVVRMQSGDVRARALQDNYPSLRSGKATKLILEIDIDTGQLIPEIEQSMTGKVYMNINPLVDKDNFEFAPRG